jgi:hypothetical protein
MPAEKKLWRNRKAGKDLTQRLQSENPRLEVVHPHAAGIDVGNGVRYVGLRLTRHQRTRLDNQPLATNLTFRCQPVNTGLVAVNRTFKPTREALGSRNWSQLQGLPAFRTGECFNVGFLRLILHFFL